MSMTKLAVLSTSLEAEVRAIKPAQVIPPPAPSAWSWQHLGINREGEVLQAYPTPPYDKGCEACFEFSGYIERRAIVDGRHYTALEKCPHCRKLTDKIDRINRAKLPSKFSKEVLNWAQIKLASRRNAEAEFVGWAEALVESSQGPSLALLGPTGRGKSFCAYTLAKYALDCDVGARWLHWPTFLESIKDTYGNNQLRPQEVWDLNLPSRGVLVVDDLGAGVVTEWSRQIAWTLFERKPLAVTFIVTSNGHPKANGAGSLDDMIGERAASRMFGTCGRGRTVYQLIGEDKRKG